MVDLVAIGEQAKDASTNFIGTVKDNPLLSAGIATAVVASAVGVTALAVSKSRKKSSKSKSKTRKRSTSFKKSRKKKSYKYARTAGKRKDTSRRRIRMTKNGQPYVITASGKAKFISKKSARLSRKRKGGRY